MDLVRNREKIHQSRTLWMCKTNTATFLHKKWPKMSINANLKFKIHKIKIMKRLDSRIMGLKEFLSTR
jgi:hypothetical protein